MLNKFYFLILFLTFALSNITHAQSLSKINSGRFRDTNNTNGSAFSAVFNDCLYVGTSNSVTGCEIWRYDGLTWTQVNIDGFGDPNNTGTYVMAVYNGSLYIGTENGDDESTLTGCEVWKTSAVGGASLYGLGTG